MNSYLKVFKATLRSGNTSIGATVGALRQQSRDIDRVIELLQSIRQLRMQRIREFGPAVGTALDLTARVATNNLAGKRTSRRGPAIV
jgi:hypothetical protein